jgi:Protein of unknown function (DUF3619)
MSLDDNPLARGVCSRLDESLEALPSEVTDRLTVMRCAALARPKKGVARTPLASKPGFLGWLQGGTGVLAYSGRWVLPAMFLAGALGFFGYAQYQHLQEQDDFDVDVALLSSDLPIDAYLDRGFSNWLRNSANQP